MVRTDSAARFAGIDPSLFFDDDGKVYYLGTDGGIYLSQLDIATGEAIGETHALWQGTANNPEGPHLYKINGMYYLLLAQGGTELCHMAVLARSKSILGPYEPCPHNPILTNIAKTCPLRQLVTPIWWTMPTGTGGQFVWAIVRWRIRSATIWDGKPCWCRLFWKTAGSIWARNVQCCRNSQ